MLRLSADAITGFSVKPLKIASYLGFLTAMLSVLLICYSLISWMFFSTVSGWTSLIIVILLLSSVQLLVLGVIGEYLGRLVTETKQRPMFIIDRVIADGKERAPRARIAKPMDRDRANL